MRRAAALAIALVVVLLLLLRARSGQERSMRGHPAWPAGIDEPGTAAAPETAAADPVANTQAEAIETEPGTIASGHVTDAGGKPLAGLRLLAIPRDNVALWDAEDPCTPPGEDPAVPFAHADQDGAFSFPSLPPGEYRLAIDEDWTLEQPVTFRADARDLRVVAVRVRLVDVSADDLGTGKPIGLFVLRYRWPPRTEPELVAHGSNGVFRGRLRDAPKPGALARNRFTDLEGVALRVEAEGYHAAWAHVSFSSANGPRTRVWLARAGDPNVTLHVVFEDGAPCDEEASVQLRRSDQKRGGTLPAMRTGAGWYQVSIPPGSWKLWFTPRRAILCHKECTADFELAEGERGEAFLKVERGGDLVVRRLGWDGKPWWLAIGNETSMSSMLVETAESELRHLTPGRYRVNAQQGETFDTLGSGVGPKPWEREIEVTTGSRHELTIE